MSDGSTITIGLAFTAGILSFLSPCVVPLVPSYLTFVTGMTLDELTDPRLASARRSRTMLHATLFVLGFAIVFVSLGAAATALGVAIGRSLGWVQRIGGVVIVLFGVHLLGLLHVPALMRERRAHIATKPAGLAGSLVVGIAFGAGWTPCVGPVLATILLYAGTSGSVARGTLLLATYALGLGLPFLMCGFGVSRLLARAAHGRAMGAAARDRDRCAPGARGPRARDRQLPNAHGLAGWTRAARQPRYLIKQWQFQS